MRKPKLQPATIAAIAASGLCLDTLWQRPQDDGRKLKLVAEKGDPWTAQLFYPDVINEFGPVVWYASFIAYGSGPTADEAVMDALAKSRGMQGTIRRLGAAVDHLTESLHVARTGRSYA